MAGKALVTAERIRLQLKDIRQLAQRIDLMDREMTGHMYTISWEPFVKHWIKEPADLGEEFVHLLSVWVNVLREDSSGTIAGHQGKSTEMLLEERFGTEELSSLEVEDIRDQSIFREMESRLIDDHGDERRRAREVKSMKYAKGIAIVCKTGDILYVGQTSTFSFLLSRSYLVRYEPPVYRELGDILFAEDLRSSVRKRPGMWIGSTKRKGLYFLLYALVESMLEDAGEKTISICLRSGNVVEIVCESYLVANNSSYIRYMGIANALGEFFEYQDEGQFIRTEQGILTGEDRNHTIAVGTRIVWKPDCTVFANQELDYFVIMGRMIELAALNPYTIYLADEEKRSKVRIPSGLEYFLEWDDLLFEIEPVLHVAIAGDQFTGEAVLSFSAVEGGIRRSYVNNRITQQGGAHVEGLLNGARRALKRIIEAHGNKLKPGALLKHLNYVVHIRIERPRWHGSTKTRLKNLEVRSSVGKQVEEQLYAFLKQDIAPLKSIYFHLF